MASTLSPGAARASIQLDLRALQAAPAVAAAAAKGVSKEIQAAMREAAAAQKVAVAQAQTSLAQVRGQQAQQTAAARAAGQAQIQAAKAAATQQQQAAIQTTATVKAQLQQQTAAHRAALQQQAAQARAAQRGQGGGFAAQVGRGVAGALAPLGGLALGAAAVGAVGAGLNASFGAARDAAFAERSAVAFDKLSGSAGAAALNLRAVQQGAGGALSRMEALRVGVQAAALGLAKTSLQFKELASAARAVTFVSPIIHDIEGAISEIALASANMSWRRLDQLGLTVTEVKDKMEELRKTQSGLDDNQLFGQAVVESLNTKYKDLLQTEGDSAQAFEKATAAAKDAQLQFGQVIQPWMISGVEAYTAAVVTLGIVLGSLSGQEMKLPGGMYSYSWTRGHNRPAPRSSGGFGRSSGADGSGGRALDSEQSAAVLDWSEGVQRIEKDAARARLDATTQYELQRTQTIQQFALANTREEEDFQRARFRAAQNLARSIGRVQADAAERDAETLADRDKRIAKIRKDAAEKIAESEADYQKERLRRERDHRDNLMDAAARLDAAAVFEEQRNFARESKDAEDDHKQAMSRERKQLQERIDQENEAAQERLDDAHKADAKRIADMRESLEEQQRIEDEDRAIRKARQQADFDAQLVEMAAAHARRIDQINRQEAEERTAHNDAFIKRMHDLGIENESLQKMYDAREKAATDAFNKFWDNVERRFTATPPPSTGRPNSGGGGRGGFYAEGGYVPRTGPAYLHAGEFVLTAQQTASLMQPGMGGNNYNSRSVQVASGAIVVHAAPGQSAGSIADEIEARFIQMLERAA